jgi:hypothetical protein
VFLAKGCTCTEEHVKALRNDKSQSFCHTGGSNYVEPPAFKSHTHHVANGIAVIHKSDFMRNGWFWSKSSSEM